MGAPSATEPWGWQWDGHHLIINYFVLGDQIVVTPTLPRRRSRCMPSVANTPACALSKATRTAAGRLKGALSEAQRAKTVIAPETSGEDFTTAFRDNLVLDYQGIRAGDLSTAQHELLLGLVEYHVGRMRHGHAQVKIA